MNYITLYIYVLQNGTDHFFLLKNSLISFLNDDKVLDIFIKSGRSFQSLVEDGIKLSMYDVLN